MKYLKKYLTCKLLTGVSLALLLFPPSKRKKQEHNIFFSVCIIIQICASELSFFYHLEGPNRYVKNHLTKLADSYDAMMHACDLRPNHSHADRQ